MTNAYTVLWNSDRVKIARKHGLAGRKIDFLFGGQHTSQPRFLRASLKAGGDSHVARWFPMQAASPMGHVVIWRDPRLSKRGRW